MLCVVFPDALRCWGLCLIRLHSAAACESVRQQCENCQLVFSLINEMVNSSHVLLLATQTDSIPNSSRLKRSPCDVAPEPLMQTCEREVSQTAWTPPLLNLSATRRPSAQVAGLDFAASPGSACLFVYSVNDPSAGVWRKIWPSRLPLVHRLGHIRASDKMLSAGTTFERMFVVWCRFAPTVQ